MLVETFTLECPSNTKIVDQLKRNTTYDDDAIVIIIVSGGMTSLNCLSNVTFQ